MFPSKVLVLFASIALSMAIAPPIAPPQPPAAAPAPASTPSAPTAPQPPVSAPVPLPSAPVRRDINDYMMTLMLEKRVDIDTHLPRTDIDIHLPRSDVDINVPRADIDVHHDLPRAPQHPHAKPSLDVEAWKAKLRRELGVDVCGTGTSTPDDSGSDLLAGLSHLSANLNSISPSSSQGLDTSDSPLDLSSLASITSGLGSESASNPITPSENDSSPPPPPPSSSDSSSSSSPPPPPPSQPADSGSSSPSSDNSTPDSAPSSADAPSSSTDAALPLLTAVVSAPDVSAPSVPVSTTPSTSDIPVPTSLVSLGFAAAKSGTEGSRILEAKVRLPVGESSYVLSASSIASSVAASMTSSILPTATEVVSSAAALIPSVDAVPALDIDVPTSGTPSDATSAAVGAATPLSGDRRHGVHVGVGPDVSTGNKRRQLNATRRAPMAKRLDVVFDPEGMTRCTEDSTGHLIYVDQSNDIGHCGGCGQECTNAMVEGASAVECNKGQCRAFACAGGYEKIMGACVKN